MIYLLSYTLLRNLCKLIDWIFSLIVNRSIIIDIMGNGVYNTDVVDKPLLANCKKET